MILDLFDAFRLPGDPFHCGPLKISFNGAAQRDHSVFCGDADVAGLQDGIIEKLCLRLSDEGLIALAPLCQETARCEE